MIIIYHKQVYVITNSSSNITVNNQNVLLSILLRDLKQPEANSLCTAPNDKGTQNQYYLLHHLLLKAIWNHKLVPFLACGQFNEGVALLGINTPIGSAFSPDMYLCCDLLCIQNKESFPTNIWHLTLKLGHHVVVGPSCSTNQHLFLFSWLSNIQCTIRCISTFPQLWSSESEP